MVKITLKQRIAAKASKIQSVLLEHEKLGRFFNAQFCLVKAENEGELSGGKGSIRQITIGKYQFKEEIVSATSHHICYRIIGEGPVSNHQGDIYLTPIETREMDDALNKSITELYYIIVCSGPKFIPDFIVKFLIAKDIKRAMMKLAEHFNEH